MADTMLDNKPEQNQAKGNVKYEVTVTCYWNKTFFREGSKVELAANLNPPKEYFKKL